LFNRNVRVLLFEVECLKRYVQFFHEDVDIELTTIEFPKEQKKAVYENKQKR
jgi:hypothetical protein